MVMVKATAPEAMLSMHMSCACRYIMTVAVVDIVVTVVAVEDFVFIESIHTVHDLVIVHVIVEERHAEHHRCQRERLEANWADFDSGGGRSRGSRAAGLVQ